MKETLYEDPNGNPEKSKLKRSKKDHPLPYSGCSGS